MYTEAYTIQKTTPYFYMIFLYNFVIFFCQLFCYKLKHLKSALLIATIAIAIALFYAIKLIFDFPQ